MQNHFGKEFRFHREGIFILSLIFFTLAFHLVKPDRPFELVVASFSLFFIAPFLVLRLIISGNASLLSLRKGKLGQGVFGLLIGWLIFLPILNLLAGQKEFQEIYPVFPAMRQNLTAFLMFEFFVFLPIFFAVQTFIFGYTYGGLLKIIGRSKAALLLSFILVPLFYFSRPPVEIILASFVTFFTCWIKNRSISILYPIIFGWGLSFILDALVLYKIFTP